MVRICLIRSSGRKDFGCRWGLGWFRLGPVQGTAARWRISREDVRFNEVFFIANLGAMLNDTKRRILVAAATVFAEVGYNSAATRSIAAAANVNETTLFRCFVSKRQLFEATLREKLRSVRISVHSISELGHAKEFHDVVRILLDVAADVVANQPELARMLHFAALEFGAEMEPMFKTTIGENIEVFSKRMSKFQPSIIQSTDPALLMTYLIVSLASAIHFFPLFSGRQLDGYSQVQRAKLYSEACKVITLSALGATSCQT